MQRHHTFTLSSQYMTAYNTRRSHPARQGSHTMVSLGLRLSEARTVTFPEFAALIEKAVAVAARRPFA